MVKRIEMIENTVSELIVEIDELWVWLRRMAMIVGLIGSVLAVTTIFHIALEKMGTKIVKASEFQVIRNGKVIAIIGALEHGGVIVLTDREGKMRVWIGANNVGGEVEIWNKWKTPMVSFGTDERGTSGRITVSRQKGEGWEIAVGIGTDHKNSGWVYTTDAYGQLLWSSP
ncbi:MAG: hypothetical protein QXY94_06755 [Archaeoglobaceae archaeon]